MNSDPSQVRQNLRVAIVAAAAGRHDEAIRGFSAVVQAQPDHWEAWARLALVHESRRDWKGAADAYRQAVAASPENPGLRCNLGMALLNQRAYAEALASFEAALRLAHDIPEVFNGRGVALKALNRLQEAAEAFQKALDVRPQQIEWWCNLGNTLAALRQFDQAHAAYDLALKLKPGHGDALFGKSLAFLLAGRLAEGFALYDSRWVSELAGCKRAFAKPEWNGRDSLEGKTLLVHCEQGLGDTIQFVRYLPHLGKLGARIFLEVQASLVELCQQAFPQVKVFAEKGAPLNFDCTCSLLSLPRLLETTLENIPANVPYLVADESRGNRWRERMPSPAEGLAVGLVSSGNRHHKNDHNRSLPLERLAGIFGGGASMFLLQKELSEADAGFLRDHSSIVHLGAEFGDFSDTAAAMENLDLIITVDTSLAHLAGAMGKPVWLLLPFAPDWRWLVDRDDSPWYPTMRLFRQTKPGDWGPVLENVRNALGQWRRPSVAGETANMRGNVPCLSLCMIVRNEREHLARCLRSVRGVADEMVVVDTGSTDDTREIAAREGARIFDFPWIDDFAKARNHSLAQATGRWILVLDADEQLTERDGASLRQLVANRNPDTAFNLVVRNSSDGGRTGMLAHVLRLFPNRSGVRYIWPIHEQVGTSLMRLGFPIENAGIEILHDGYSDAAHNVEKQRRNLAILEKQIAGGGAIALTFFLKGGAHLDLGEYEPALEAYSRCIQMAATGDPFLAGARVRVPVCLFKLGRPAEACQAIVQPQHPEEWLVLGNSDAALGRTRESIEAFRTLLSMDDAVFMPPCDLVTLKLEAIMTLASLLKAQGRNAAAVQLMRDAVARRQGGLGFDAAWARSLAL